MPSLRWLSWSILQVFVVISFLPVILVILAAKELHEVKPPGRRDA